MTLEKELTYRKKCYAWQEADVTDAQAVQHKTALLAERLGPADL